MFDFLKKKDDSPPDIGKEDVAEAGENIDNSFDTATAPDEEALTQKSARKKKTTSKRSASVSNYGDEPEMPTATIPANYSLGMQQSIAPTNSFELEKINARLEVINSFIKTFNERFALVNQQIGEIRAMAVNNEKNLSLSNLDAKKVVDLVKEVNPEKLRVDYQKLDFRFNTLSEKIEANKQFVDSIVEEFKELKRKASLFEGTDALLRLNQDVKKDLIEIQKVSSRVRLNADKSEQIFIELSKGFQENQKINEVITTLDNSYSVLRKEFEKINMDHKQTLNVDDFNDFKKKIGSKSIIFESAIAEMEKVKEENEKLSSIIERILSMEKKNEEDIVNLSLARGAGNVTSASDYEQKLFSILELVDKMSIELNALKKKNGMPVTEEKSVLPAMKNFRTSAPASMPKIENEEIQKTETPEVETENNIERISREMSSNKKKILALLFEGRTLLQQGNSSDAIKIYETVSGIYDSADDNDNSLYSKIIKFYDDVTAAINRPSIVPPVHKSHGVMHKTNRKVVNKKHKTEKKYTINHPHNHEVKYSLSAPVRKFKKLSDY